MKRTQSLKLNKDFKRLYYRGKSVVRGNVVVYVCHTKSGKNRLGLTCSKSIGKAVKRNRAKRLMREGYRLLEDRLKTGFDIVIVARTKIVNVSCKQVIKELEYAFMKLGILSDNE